MRYALDPAAPPPLTPKQRKELAAMAAKTDARIDMSDIALLDAEFWNGSVRGKFYRPIKQQVTMRLDADVLDWFKRKAKGGKGYQTDINRALHEHVAREQKKAG